MHIFTATETDPLSGLTSPPSDPFTVNVLPGTQSMIEEGAVTFSSQNGNQIFVWDPDSPTLAVTVSAGHGTVTLGSLAGLTVSAGANGTSSITVTGTKVDLVAALNGLVYRGSQDFNGSDTLTIISLDGTSPVTNTVAISVAAVNDAPTVVKGAAATLAAIDEDSDPRGATVDSLFGMHFSDAADDQTANGGTVANTLAGIAITANAATAAEGIWQYFDSAWHDIVGASVSNAVLVDARHLLRFLPAADRNGTTPALTVYLIDDSAGAVPSGSTADLTSPAARHATAPPP